MRARDSLTVQLAIPSDTMIWTSLCPTDTDRAAHGFVRVLTTNARTGALQDGVTVRVAWSGTDAAGVTATTDDDGAVTTCKVPTDRPIHVAAMVDGREVASRTLTLTAGEMRVVPLAVPSKP